MPTINFQPLFRPQKVSWIYPLESKKSVLENIHSKHAIKFLSGLNEFLTNHQLEVSTGVCSRTEYEEFLQLYNERVAARGFESIANLEWYKTKEREGKSIEKLFIKQSGVLVGGKIITVIDKQVRSSYKASVQLPIFQKPRNASLGLILDYLMLEHYIKTKPTLLTAGTSRNLFGVINTIGYLVFKLRIGYLPKVINPNTTFEQSTPTPNQPVWFTFLSQTTKINNNLNLYYCGELSQVALLPELQKLTSFEKLQRDV